jgi:hypothetical protein
MCFASSLFFIWFSLTHSAANNNLEYGEYPNFYTKLNLFLRSCFRKFLLLDFRNKIIPKTRDRVSIYSTFPELTLNLISPLAAIVKISLLCKHDKKAQRDTSRSLQGQASLSHSS